MDHWTTGCIFTTDTGRHARAGRKTSKDRDCETVSKSIPCVLRSYGISQLKFGVIADLAGDPADGESFRLGFSHGCGSHEAIFRACQENLTWDQDIEQHGNTRAPCALTCLVYIERILFEVLKHSKSKQNRVDNELQDGQ